MSARSGIKTRAFLALKLWGRLGLSARARLEIDLAVSLLARARHLWWSVETMVISLMLPSLCLFFGSVCQSSYLALWGVHVK